MFRNVARPGRRSRLFAARRPVIALALIVVLCLLLAACDSSPAPSTQATPSGGNNTPSFPTTAPPLRTPTFSSSEQVAPTVKVLASMDPSLIVQFPLVPSGLKKLFPNAKALVTVVEDDPAISVFDTVTVDVSNMPALVKFTVFFTEISVKPFGHAEYVGDVYTRSDGSGESVFHLITFAAFAADNRSPGKSVDQSGVASGIQLEHVGMWFDGIESGRQVLQNPNLAGTPFDGGRGVLHAGPQAMTDGQTLPVI